MLVLQHPFYLCVLAWLVHTSEAGHAKASTVVRRQLHIYGVDDRQVTDDSTANIFPFISVGRFRRGRADCTAVIIDEDLILTNRHCLGISSAGQLSPDFWSTTSFETGVNNGNPKYTSSLVEARWSSEVEDFAILRLNEKIGNRTGFPEIEWTDRAYFKTNRAVFLVGHNADSSTVSPSHQECSTRGLVVGLEYTVMHDCDTLEGSSGSPLFSSLKNDAKLVGYNYGEFRDTGITSSQTFPSYQDKHANLMLPAGLFRLAYLEMQSGRAETPGGASTSVICIMLMLMVILL